MALLLSSLTAESASINVQPTCSMEFVGDCVPDPVHFSASEYFPLHPGNQATYIVNGATTVTGVVPASTVNVNGVPTRPVSVSGFMTEYYTNDAQGFRVHRRDFSSGEIAVLNPPITVTTSQFSLGQTRVSNGIATHTVPGFGTFNLNYTATSNIETVELVTVPLETFNAVRIETTVRETGLVQGIPIDVTSVSTIWVAQHYGPARRIDAIPNIGTFDAQLVAVSIDTDGDGVNVTDDNCPAVSNPLQTDTDGGGIGDLCDDDDDNDGLLDNQEITLGTDPLDADTDNDALNDGDEVASGRNPLVNEGAVGVIINSILSE